MGISEGTAVLLVFAVSTVIKIVQDWRLGRSAAANAKVMTESLKQLTALVNDHEARLGKLEAQ